MEESLVPLRSQATSKGMLKKDSPVKRIVKQFYEDLMSDLPPNEQPEAIIVLLELIAEDKQRLRMP